MKIFDFCIFIVLIWSVFGANFFPHIIWLYWDGGYQTLSNYSKACLQRIRSLHQNTDWEIRFMDNSTLNKWFDQNQFRQLNQIFNGAIKLQIQAKADFYRLFLLKKYGGVWLDVTILLHQNLNWLDQLKQNSYVLNKDFSSEPQFFYFFINRQSEGKTHINYKGYNIFTKLDGQNSFLAAPKQSRFIKHLIQQFKNLVVIGPTQFFYNAQDLNFPFQYKPYWMAYLATAIIQYKKDKAFNQLIEQNQKIPLQNFYAIWSISRNIGLYHHTEYANQIRRVFQQPLRGDKAKYMTKIHHFQKEIMQNILSGSQIAIQKESKQSDYQMFEQGKKYFSYEYKCLYQIRIDKNSVFNQYLLSKIDRSKYYQNAFIVQNKQLPYICTIFKLKQLKKIWQIVFLWGENSFWILILCQFLVEYFYIFKVSDQVKKTTSLTKRQLKQMISKKLFALIFLEGQFNLIHSQYQLWLNQSPQALDVIIILIFMTLPIIYDFFRLKTYFLFFNIRFYFFVLILLIIQYIVQYYSTVWRYEGAIYNYETLRRMNFEKLYECQLEFFKILTLIVCFKVLQNFINIMKTQILSQQRQTQKEDKVKLIQRTYVFAQYPE